MNDLDLESMRTMNSKLFAETIKLQAETAKLNREARWYPLIALAAFTGAVAAVAKLFFGA